MTTARTLAVLNYIWLALVVCAVVIGGWNDRLKEVTGGAFDGAKTAVTIALGLIGIMALWLGIMRLAERAGLVQRIARGLRPLLQRLFPDVPSNHPAMGSMLMNMAANMLGLGNAATPLGLRAMRDLETLNPRPGVATNAMCTFLAINTSSVQLIPATAIAILAASGSTRPTAIVGTAFLATLCAATVAVISAKFFERLTIFQPRREPGEVFDKSPTPSTRRSATQLPEEMPIVEEPPRRLSALGLIAVVLLTVFFFALFLRIVSPGLFNLPVPAEMAAQNVFVRCVNALSILAIPFLLSFFPIYAAARGLKVYEEFVEGAKEGFGVILKIIPFLVTMLVAIGMFKGAGGIDLLTSALKPILAPAAISARSLAAGVDAALERKRDPGAFDGYRSPARARKYCQPDGGDDLWKHRDDILRGGGLFWSRRREANAACYPSRFAGRSHRRDRLCGRLPRRAWMNGWTIDLRIS